MIPAGKLKGKMKMCPKFLTFFKCLTLEGTVTSMVGSIHFFFLILKFKFINYEKVKFKFIDFEKTKFKFIDLEKFKFMKNL